MNPLFNPYLEKINEPLQSLIQKYTDQDLWELRKPIAYTLSHSGKRIRPLLCLLVASIYMDGEKEEKKEDKEKKEQAVISLATALEVFHNFTLVHDDLMDNSPLRRNEPTVHALWGANRAILSGDVMLIEAYKCLQSLPPQQLALLLTRFNEMAEQVCLGQQMDMILEERPLGKVSMVEYLEMISYKTSVLLSACLSFTAELLDATKAELELLSHAGIMMGGAFQIMDDYLDLYAETHQFGKRKGSDIIERKKTWLLLSAYALAPKETQMAIDIVDYDKRIKEVQKIYDYHEIPLLAVAQVEKMTDNALRTLELIPHDTTLLKKLFLELVKRSK